MSRIKPDDIKVFSDAAGAFFYQTTGIAASVRTAYMLDGKERIDQNYYQSKIALGGQFEGMVAFSAPRALLTNILLRMGESDYSDASHHDITGEIANQMSGYVRRYFGEGMDISPPQALAHTNTFAHIGIEEHSFVIPMLWDSYEAKLFVSIKKIA